jgi:hypothetical protein
MITNGQTRKTELGPGTIEYVSRWKAERSTVLEDTSCGEANHEGEGCLY